MSQCSTALSNYEIVARPFPGGQTILLAAAQINEIMYGGQRGAAKSHGLLLDWLKYQEMYGKKAKGLFFRRTFKDIQDLIQRALVLFQPFGARWTNSTDKTTTFVFPNGATLRFGHMNNDTAWVQYKGQEYTRVYVDEADEFPNFEPIQLLYGSMRSTDPILPICLRLSSNPGGNGNPWIKERYVDPMPPYSVLRATENDPITGEDVTLTRMFIPGKLSENPLLNTKEYRRRLKEAATTEEIYEAWLRGNYSIGAGGAYFKNFKREKHVIHPFIIPPHWDRICAWDPGTGHPSALVYFAVVRDEGSWNPPRLIGGSDSGFEIAHRYRGNLPYGSLVCYRELYFAKKAGGAGSKWIGMDLPYQEQARQIVEAEKYQDVFGVRYKEQLDSSGRVKHTHRIGGRDIENELGRVSIKTIMNSYGLHFTTAQKTGDDRLRKTGWNQIRNRLIGENGRPMIYWMSHCIHSIRKMQELIVDEDDRDDVLKTGDDDLGDAIRYACMCRKYISDFAEDPVDNFNPDNLHNNWKSGVSGTEYGMNVRTPELGESQQYGIKFTPATRLK